MNTINLNKFFLAMLLILPISSFAQTTEDTAEHKHSGWDLEKSLVTEDHHALVHPFLAHMGMPDGPGEMSTRINSVEQRSGSMATGNYGFHLEAGLADKFGLHLRNDAVNSRPTSEMMLQYAVLKSASGLSGISIFGEAEFPTGPAAENNDVNGLYGISFAYIVVPVIAINSTIHYGPRDQMTEWEISFVKSLTDKIFPVLEFNGEIMKNGNSITNALIAWKFKIPNNNALGIAYQFPASIRRDFDSQLLLQAEFGFH